MIVIIFISLIPADNEQAIKAVVDYVTEIFYCEDDCLILRLWLLTPVAIASAAKAIVTAVLVLPFGFYHSLSQTLVLSSIKMSSFCGESRMLCGNELQVWPYHHFS